jgi:hypothetical protein
VAFHNDGQVVAVVMYEIYDLISCCLKVFRGSFVCVSFEAYLMSVD